MSTDHARSRPRRRALAASTAAIALLVAGCGGDAAAGVPEATAQCGPVEFPELQFGSHLLGDTAPPIPYSSVPPTSGWHTSGAPPVGAFDRPISEAQQVSTLEGGAVVVTYNDLPPDELDVLATTLGGALDDRVLLTPYDQLSPGEVALASWGAVQRCDGVDAEAVTTYVEAFADPVDTHVQSANDTR